jgi:hypothetical protein
VVPSAETSRVFRGGIVSVGGVLASKDDSGFVAIGSELAVVGSTERMSPIGDLPLMAVVEPCICFVGLTLVEEDVPKPESRGEVICEDGICLSILVDVIGEVVSKDDKIKIDEVDRVVVEAELKIADANLTAVAAFVDEDLGDGSASLPLGSGGSRTKAVNVIGFAMLEEGRVVAMLLAVEVCWAFFAEAPGVNAMTHLQPASKLSTERPGTGDRDLGLPGMLSYGVVKFVLERELTS